MIALKIVLAMLVLGAYAVSLYGWGRLVCRASGDEPRPWGLVVTLGLAAIVFVGGVLNLLRLARAPALDVVVIVGWIVTAASLRARRPRWSAPRLAQLAVWGAVAAVMAFVIATQLPPKVFNFHDDLIVYFEWPVRMLATGTLYAHPLSGLGRIVLGGQAFLHGFPLAHFPITYLNGVDAVFGLGLCLSMVVSYVTWRGRGEWAALAGVVAIAVVNPQYVNISPLYLGCALAIAGSLLAVARVESGAGGSVARSTVPFALVYSALAALKMTFAPWIAAHLLSSAVAIGIRERSAGRGARWALSAAGWSACLLAPWLALYAPFYVRALGATRPAATIERSGTASIANPFDRSELFYGDTVQRYTFLGLSVLALAIAFAVAGARSSDDGARVRARAFAIALLGGALAHAATLEGFSWVLAGDLDTAMRYAVPFAIAAAASAWVVGLVLLPPLVRPALARWVPGTIAVVALGCVVPFVPGAIARGRQALEHGSILAFRELANAPEYAAYHTRALGPRMRANVEAVQALVPPGQPLLAWISTPFLLDYARNPIIDLDLGGLTNPWASDPPHSYVLWEYRGFATISQECDLIVRRRNSLDVAAGLKCLEWRNRLAYAATRSDVLFNDGATVLFRLRMPPGP